MFHVKHCTTAFFIWWNTNCMKILAFLSLTLLVSAQSANTFEVKELDPPEVTHLVATEAAYSAKLEAFKLAHSELESAKAERDRVLASAINKFAPYEGQCNYPSHSGMTWVSGARSYRRVEIRGKYALISDGSESCGNSGAILTYGNGSNSTLDFQNRPAPSGGLIIQQ